MVVWVKGYWIEWMGGVVEGGGSGESVVMGMVNVYGRGGGMGGVVGWVKVVEGCM